MFWPTVDPEEASGVFSLLMFRPSTLKTKLLKGEEMRLNIQVSCSESLCIVLKDRLMYQFTGQDVRLAKLYQKHCSDVQEGKCTLDLHNWSVCCHIFFLHQFSSREKGCRDLIQLREWLFPV